MTQNPKTHSLKSLTPSVEKTVNLYGFKLSYKPRYVNVVFSRYGL